MAEKTEEKKVTKRKTKVKDIKIEEPITEEVIEDIKEGVEKALEEIEEHTDEPIKETEEIVKAVEPLPYDPYHLLQGIPKFLPLQIPYELQITYPYNTFLSLS